MAWSRASPRRACCCGQLPARVPARAGAARPTTQLRLDRLPPESAEALLERCSGDDPSASRSRRLLIERTEGNPFFLEESVRTLVETGALVGRAGRIPSRQDPDRIQVPATVQAILAARIDRLPPEEKRLLQAAAVIGKDVPFALLPGVAEQPEDDLRRGLGAPAGGRVPLRDAAFPELEYTFKHALTHEVAYGSLLQERRRRCTPGSSGDRALYPDRLTEQVERSPTTPSRRGVGQGPALSP